MMAFITSRHFTCLITLPHGIPPTLLVQGLVGDSFGQLGERAESVSRLCSQTSDTLASSFEAPLKEFVRTVKAVKKVMADRSAALQACQQVGGAGAGCGGACAGWVWEGWAGEKGRPGGEPVLPPVCIKPQPAAAGWQIRCFMYTSLSRSSPHCHHPFPSPARPAARWTPGACGWPSCAALLAFARIVCRRRSGTSAMRSTRQRRPGLPTRWVGGGWVGGWVGE